MIRATAIALAFALGCGGLFETPPVSAGTCTGTAGGGSVAGEVYPSGSYIARDDQHHGVEHAFFGLAVLGPGEVVLDIRGHFADMPDAAYVGDHPLVGGTGYVDRWDLRAPAGVQPTAGILTIESATRMHLRGRFWMDTSDGGRVECDFVVGRDLNRDTDD